MKCTGNTVLFKAGPRAKSRAKARQRARPLCTRLTYPRPCVSRNFSFRVRDFPRLPLPGLSSRFLVSPPLSIYLLRLTAGPRLEGKERNCVYIAGKWVRGKLGGLVGWFVRDRGRRRRRRGQRQRRRRWRLRADGSEVYRKFHFGRVKFPATGVSRTS